MCECPCVFIYLLSCKHVLNEFVQVRVCMKFCFYLVFKCFDRYISRLTCIWKCRSIFIIIVRKIRVRLLYHSFSYVGKQTRMIFKYSCVFFYLFLFFYLFSPLFLCTSTLCSALLPFSPFSLNDLLLASCTLVNSELVTTSSPGHYFL